MRTNAPLENIGFYTLEDKRARHASYLSPLWRCELLITDRCNFHCPYCRGSNNYNGGDLAYREAVGIIDLWGAEGLKNIRFSGGEPTVYPELANLVLRAKEAGIKRIAVSTNGSRNLEYYHRLIYVGVNDFSISLDACCSAFGKKMTGGIKGAWEVVVRNITELSKETYVTVGMVFSPENMEIARESVEFASSLGVADIRIISSAQYNDAIREISRVPSNLLLKHPILRYRVINYRKGRNVRGLSVTDARRCYLVLDDMAVAGGSHYPCIIYHREKGKPIGRVGPDMRLDRLRWSLFHDPYKDVICRKNCLDVCIDYNNKKEILMENNQEDLR